MLPFALSPSLSLSPFRRFIINFRENFSIGFNYGESTASLKLDVSFYHSSVLGLNPFTPREDMPFRGKNRNPPVLPSPSIATALLTRRLRRGLGREIKLQASRAKTLIVVLIGERLRIRREKREREEKRKDRESERRREGGKERREKRRSRNISLIEFRCPLGPPRPPETTTSTTAAAGRRLWSPNSIWTFIWIIEIIPLAFHAPMHGPVSA